MLALDLGGREKAGARPRRRGERRKRGPLLVQQSIIVVDEALSGELPSPEFNASETFQSRRKRSLACRNAGGKCSQRRDSQDLAQPFFARRKKCAILEREVL